MPPRIVAASNRLGVYDEDLEWFRVGGADGEHEPEG